MILERVGYAIPAISKGSVLSLIQNLPVLPSASAVTSIGSNLAFERVVGQPTLWKAGYFHLLPPSNQGTNIPAISLGLEVDNWEQPLFQPELVSGAIPVLSQLPILVVTQTPANLLPLHNAVYFEPDPVPLPGQNWASFITATTPAIQQVLVPEVEGLDQATAISILIAALLQPQVIAGTDPGTPIGNVISQSIPAGTLVDQNTVIVLTVQLDLNDGPILRESDLKRRIREVQGAYIGKPRDAIAEPPDYIGAPDKQGLSIDDDDDEFLTILNS